MVPRLGRGRGGCRDEKPEKKNGAKRTSYPLKRRKCRIWMTFDRCGRHMNRSQSSQSCVKLHRLARIVRSVRGGREDGKAHRDVVLRQRVIELVRLRDRNDRILRRAPDQRRRRNLRVVRDRRVVAVDALAVAGLRRGAERITILHVRRREIVFVELAVDRRAGDRGAPKVIVTDQPRRQLAAVRPAGDRHARRSTSGRALERRRDRRGYRSSARRPYRERSPSCRRCRGYRCRDSSAAKTT